MNVTAELHVVLRTAPDVVGVAPRTVVAIPPSDLSADPDRIVLYAGGSQFSRAYDPEMEP